MYDEYGDPSETLVSHWNEHNDHGEDGDDGDDEPDRPDRPDEAEPATAFDRLRDAVNALIAQEYAPEIGIEYKIGDLREAWTTWMGQRGNIANKP